mmetsp:Transcript_4561/g.11005  ORF Transcript_4561/g.11005 Transcript_4561/m.11005 type:complete len:83 (-) Transcript_4561:1008-1256(-)
MDTLVLSNRILRHEDQACAMSFDQRLIKGQRQTMIASQIPIYHSGCGDGMETTFDGQAGSDENSRGGDCYWTYPIGAPPRRP